MNDVEVLTAERIDAPAPTAVASSPGVLDTLRRLAGKLDTERMLPIRYGLTAGVIGVPGSILQLWAMLFIWEAIFGGYNTLTLNALWLLNFEIGLFRNFALHCAYTWKLKPTWGRLRHAHVAAIGALIIDLAAFNIVVYTTGIVLLAQVFGAGSGFGFNFGYNKLKTFAQRRHLITIEEVA